MFKNAEDIRKQKLDQISYHGQNQKVNEDVIKFLINEASLVYSATSCYIKYIHPENKKKLLDLGYTITDPVVTDDFETNMNWKISWDQP